MQTTLKSGCGSGSCGCGAPATANPPLGDEAEQSARPPSQLAAKPTAPRRINGITLTAPEGAEAYTDWTELAHTELLRQEAVTSGLLPATTGTEAPELTDADRTVIEAMVDAAVNTPEPTAQECARYFEANKPQFVIGQALHVRHILFAVTPGVNVNTLAQHAEKALLSLLAKAAPADQFSRLAGELSNCPTSTQGGDLGWIGPKDCAPELANELFHQKHTPWGIGVHPRLVHSRFGLHILEVLGQREGEQKNFDDVRARIATQLTLQSRAKALHQYMRLLVGQAQIEGIELEGADSPLVQ